MTKLMAARNSKMEEKARFLLMEEKVS